MTDPHENACMRVNIYVDYALHGYHICYSASVAIVRDDATSGIKPVSRNSKL